MDENGQKLFGIIFDKILVDQVNWSVHARNNEMKYFIF